MAPLRFVGIGKLQMCKEGKLYSLDVDSATNTAMVPAGQRITVGSFMYFSEYMYNYSCRPVTSFIPDASRAYVSNAGVADRRCFIELVRQDSSRDTGVMLEPTIGPGSCAKLDPGLAPAPVPVSIPAPAAGPERK
jgi:hypothetical protein